MRRRALCIALSRFGDLDGGLDYEPGTGAKDPLPFAGQRAEAVSAALQQLGYACDTADETTLPTAAALGAAVTEAISQLGDNDVLVVHVLSHGENAQSGVHVVGADGDWTPATNVAGWVAQIEDYPPKSRPHTLFLVDACYAGDAARLEWLRVAGSRTRAWVIAATGPGELAYEGRFSQAVANVLAGIASGTIDLYPNEYVPFSEVVEQVRREVGRLGGSSQTVTGTPVDGRPVTPFFPNPRRPAGGLVRVRQDADAAVVPFLDLDTALDPAHFLDRAAGHRFGEALRSGCFTGRAEELAGLSAWLDGEMPGSVRVVTGGAGSGKSALLGILVCAAHPLLRTATEQLWSAVGKTCLPQVNPHLAGVHLRERDLPQALAALTRQLLLPVAGTGADPDAVINAIARLAQPPAIVVDALDEATGQDAIMTRLLLPLAGAVRADGSPACRLLIGMRDWAQFGPLRDLADNQGGLVDLDQIPAELLRADLCDYLNNLLSLMSYPSASRRVLTDGIAGALTAPDRERGGEFLAAALYANWLTGQHPGGVTPHLAAELICRVPSSAPAILDLELATIVGDPWPRAVLSTLAYAHGAGMPATVIARLAPLFCTGNSATDLVPAEFGRALRRIRFYLRSSPDTDGTTLYQLFHQGLADHLRSGTTDLSALLDRLLATAPLDDTGRRRWDAAEPYVRRHATRHAVDAGRLDQLIQADPQELEPLFNTTATPQGRLAAAIYRESLRGNHATDPVDRRNLLALNAARFAAPELAQQLADLPELPAPSWWPRWSTGVHLTAPHHAVMTGHDGEVYAVACTNVDGRPVAVTGGDDGTVRLWDLATGQPRGEPLIGHDGPVFAVACTTIDAGPVAITGGHDGKLRSWDLATGRPRGTLVTDHDGPVIEMACITLDSTPVVVTGGTDGTVRVWDLAIGKARGEPLTGHDGPVISMACTTLDRGPVAVTRGRDGVVRVWDLATGQPRGGPLTGHSGSVHTVACTTIDGPPLVVTSGYDGVVQVWDLATGQPRGGPLTDHAGPVRAMACTMIDGTPMVVTGRTDGVVQVWDLATGQPHGRPLTGHQGPVFAVQCTTTVEDGTLFVTTGDDGTVRVWDLVTIGQPRGGPPTSHSGPVTAAACTTADSSPVVVTGGRDGVVRVWDLATGQPCGRPMTGHDGPVFAVACTTIDGTTVVVTGGFDGLVRVWDLATGQPGGRPLTSHSGPVRAVACTTIDGTPVVVVVSGRDDGVVQVWDLVTGQPRGEPLTSRDSELHALACGMGNADTVVVTGRHKGSLRVFDLHGRLLTQDGGGVNAVACATVDGTPVVVTGGGDGVVRVWDLATGQPRGRPMVGHSQGVTAVACITVDGSPVVVSGGFDGVAWVWDLATGQARGRPMTAHGVPVHTMACTTANGSPVVATGGYDGALRVWDLATHSEITSMQMPHDVHTLAASPAGDLVVCCAWEALLLSCYRKEAI